jgi:hypothetical protein
MASSSAATTTTKKASRKPKIVYNGFIDDEDAASAGGSAANAMSDDENIILQLNVHRNSGGVTADAADSANLPAGPPDPYNNHEYKTFESKPFELTNTDQNLLSMHHELTNQDDDQPCLQHCAPSSSATSTGASRLKVVDLLRDFEEKSRHNEWPSSTNVACYWCCHKFEGGPFGLPIKYNGSTFSVLGCFCSLECASAWNFASQEGMDEIWERNSLINMLSMKLQLATPIRPAPNRLMLNMFGGPMDIAQFRKFCQTTKVVTINFPPMVAMTQQVEEVFESDITNDFKYVPLDNARVDRYKEKLRLKRAKSLINPKNTLDHTMNLRIQPGA